jgi:DNA-binding NarL/FixJ family response regulator
VIAISDHPALRTRVLEAGAVAFLDKSPNIAFELQNAIDALIHGGRSA